MSLKTTIERHRHDQQHPPIQQQGVLRYALVFDLGGHGFKCDDWAIDLSNLATNSCGASLCWTSGFRLSASVLRELRLHRLPVNLLGQKDQLVVHVNEILQCDFKDGHLMLLGGDHYASIICRFLTSI